MKNEASPLPKVHIIVPGFRILTEINIPPRAKTIHKEWKPKHVVLQLTPSLNFMIKTWKLPSTFTTCPSSSLTVNLRFVGERPYKAGANQCQIFTIIKLFTTHSLPMTDQSEQYILKETNHTGEVLPHKHTK